MPLKVTDTPEYTEAWHQYCMNYKGMVTSKHVKAFAAGLQKYVELTAKEPLVSNIIVDETHGGCDDPNCHLHRPRK